ncbi:type II CAAX prenyl endopeptidase Rce1 family protein [Staphylococcus lutrae]|uniref:CAAX protease family protein n=1 Tax=Staphylococcus lutrae TaxID=155085 RepID=A0AAC9RQP6_9STAP|nr:CPBP family intramembrane glutamic endopeptidase [Staphylococcus lutrae]ARJ50488.1 CAAX protease family protein [Staphylococcus lutrae]PNZ38216.1 CPBP family intramembrane metalloprotease [Staphylococcus lutrae]
MNRTRISGFQWAMTIFVFFVLSYVIPIILQDFQKASGLKSFVFTLNSLGPFIAAVICILVFKNKKEQLAGLKFSINLKVIERLLIAFTLPLIIFMIGMYIFNTYADSFILLQSKDLSESICTILIGHILMAFFIELGFRSYLLNIVETRLPHFFSNIVVSVLYLVWDVNTAFGMPYTLYSAIYVFAFSMIAGELVRGTGGRAIYVATLFHAGMTFAKVFFFSEEIGDVFSMKVLAYSTAGVAIVVVILGLLMRLFTLRQKEDVVEAPVSEDETAPETEQQNDDVNDVNVNEAHDVNEAEVATTSAESEEHTEETK